MFLLVSFIYLVLYVNNRFVFLELKESLSLIIRNLSDVFEVKLCDDKMFAEIQID